MTIILPAHILHDIYANGEASYPEESAGLLLGESVGAEGTPDKKVLAILPLTNAREDEARHNRYLITPQDMLRGEQEAMKRGMDVIGVYHSHPDHPDQPSEFDREWALPWYSYVITSIQLGKATRSRSWLLSEDRKRFIEEPVEIVN